MDVQHGWPSGLRRQTQAMNCFARVGVRHGCSGIVIDAWVRIPLRAKLFPQGFCDSDCFALPIHSYGKTDEKKIE
uniref:Uncharacterized protein n=1 Tax=Setaria digitata TaxID=48799 RepID=A0A915PXT5_9BILA